MNFVSEYGFESIEHIMDLYSEDFLIQILLSMKVEEFVMENTVAG